MKDQQTDKDIRIVTPAKDGKLKGPDGEILFPPAGWAFLPAGDAGVTRKVTANGVFWRVEVKKGRRTMSLGIWAPEQTIRQAQNDVEAMRSTTAYHNRKIYNAERREKKQSEYDTEFCRAVEKYLNFHIDYKELEQKFARMVTNHAIPIGSGTVARTQMISIEERAAHAVIAWMRHQTTAYDNMQIARVKGERRSIRRQLAQQSVDLLAGYREGKAIEETCPLMKALNRFNHDK